MSKKVLSLALVVVMLMSMFAFSANAADLQEGQIGLRVETNAYVGMPAGEEVEFKVYYVLPDGTDLETYRQASGNFAIGYSSEAYAINTSSASNAKDARDWGASYDFFNPAAAVTVTTAVSNTIAGYADESYGWDKGCQVVLSYLSGAAYKAATGFPVDPDCEIFTLRFITQKTIEEDDTIGIVAGAYGQNFFKLSYWKSNTSTSNLYAVENVDLSNIVSTPSAPAAEPTVTHEKTMGQMKDWADTSATSFNAGFVGRISNLTPEFDGKECTTIKSIVVEVTRGSVTLTGNAYQIYAQEDGSYLFRAVVNGASISDAETVSYKYIVTLDNGSELTAEGTTSFKAIYDTAKANYDAANA